ncbi:MAG: glycoside hydrolase family 3 protein [Candidatus Izemoplasmatales bacterium]
MNKRFEDLSLDEKIGQCLIFGFDALEVNDHAIEMIQKYKVGNVILFQRNVRDLHQLYELNQNLQKLALYHIGIPLFITIDQEGGMVTRIKGDGPFFPGAMTITSSEKIDNAYFSGKYMGEFLKNLGINLNLAPTLDINNNPLNPVIGVRSFGDTPKKVVDFGIPYVRGLEESIYACGKHFPGHGDTHTDSHLSLPVIHKTVKELKNFELIPFQKAIQEGIHSLMIAHINFPELTENGLPTSLSKNCITGLLREDMKYDGLVMTDCLEMKAIQKHYTTEKGFSMALLAGADLGMVSHHQELQIKAITYLKESILAGTIDEAMVDQHVKRILKYKQDLQVDLTTPFEKKEKAFYNKEVKSFNLSVVKSAFTLVKGECIHPSRSTLVISSSPAATTIADEAGGFQTIDDVVKGIGHPFESMVVSVALSKEEMKKVLRVSKEYEQIIFASYNPNQYPSQYHLMEKLNEQGNLFVFTMRNPYDLHFLPKLKNVVEFYEYTPNSLEVFKEYLEGTILPKDKGMVL